MSFIEARLLDELSHGFSGGPTWFTRRTPLRSGIVRRNVIRTKPIHKFRGSFDRREAEIVQALLNTFNATRGGAYGFRFRNPMDHEVTYQPIVIAEGGEQEVQLVKYYEFGTETAILPICKPAPDIIVFADGSPISADVDYTTGWITFTASAGQEIAWSGQFDIPVVFTNDDFVATIEDWNTTTVDVQLEEDISQCVQSPLS